MYPKFIVVRDVDQGCMLSLNVTNICGFNEYCDDADKTVIAMTDGVFHVVDHTYEEIRQMITESGCLIRKQDPRLDLTHPLSLEDLKDMIGEPVWCTNVDSWMLVKSADDLSVRVVWVSGNTSEYSEDDLRKFPMYRMKR